MLQISVYVSDVLSCSGAVAYIGGNWDRDIAFAGYAVPLQVRRALQNPSTITSNTTLAAPACAIRSRKLKPSIVVSDPGKVSCSWSYCTWLFGVCEFTF